MEFNQPQKTNFTPLPDESGGFTPIKAFREGFDKKRFLMILTLITALALPVATYYVYNQIQTTQSDAAAGLGGQYIQDPVCMTRPAGTPCGQKEVCGQDNKGNTVCKTFYWGSCDGYSTQCRLTPSCRVLWSGPCSCSWYAGHPTDCSQAAGSCNDPDPTCYKECQIEVKNPFYDGPSSCDEKETGVRCACSGNRNPPPSPPPPSSPPPPPSGKCTAPDQCLDAATAAARRCISPVASQQRCSLGGSSTLDGYCCPPVGGEECAAPQTCIAATQQNKDSCISSSTVPPSCTINGGAGICCMPLTSTPTPTATPTSTPTPTPTRTPTPSPTVTGTPPPTRACVLPTIDVEVECATCGAE